MAGDIPTTRLDIAGDATAADPWPVLRALREAGPVVWHEVYGRWMVTSDRAVRRVLTNFGRYTVEGTTSADLFGHDAFISIDDRRRHDALRDVWAVHFRRQGLEAIRTALDAILDRLIDPVAQRLNDGETVDITRTLCRPLPTLVIALMMGVPQDRIEDVVRWSDAMAGGAMTYLSGEDAARILAAREEAKRHLADFLSALLRERRAAPGDDLVSALVHSDAGRALPDGPLVQNLRQLLFAGNETTAKWLAHIFVTYGERPGIQREIADDRALLPRANDEVMRWQTVVGTLVRRVCGGPIDLAGVKLPDGADITCLLGAANRDPARYDDPDRFDIHRAAHPSLGFGVGFHNCLGAVLAKVEAQAAMNRLFDRIDGFAVTEPYRYTSLPLRGPLPVLVARARL